jgi:hypothetical protein
MQNITIKSGTSAKISITPKINGMVATASQLSGVSIYVFFVYQFTNKVYNEPYILTADNLEVNLTPADTIAMLGSADENQKYELQFAIKNAQGEIIAEDTDSNISINIQRWEAGIWLNK